MSSSWSWFVRLNATTFLSFFIKYNTWTLRQAPEFIDHLLEIILTLMRDEVIEVRTSASNTFVSFISWHLIDSERSRQLIADFRTKASDPSNSLVVRHYAILGLSSQLYAFKRVPPHLPEILVFLSKHLHDKCKPIQVV